jgi:23S rRNA (cytosine1962-C5)-methyltransferase
LEQGQKTGWFYDHRLNRARLNPYVSNQRVLDVFSYLGGWGIQAAVNGAKQVLCLDSSPLSTIWITKNAELNNVSKKIGVLEQDAFVGLKELHQAKETFDIIVLDPPAFIKKQKDKKEGLIAYQRINELALKLLSPDGILLSCSCSHHMTDEELMNTIRRASQKTHAKLQILERGYQAPDHPVHPAIPETHYLKMLISHKI